METLRYCPAAQLKQVMRVGTITLRALFDLTRHTGAPHRTMVIRPGMALGPVDEREDSDDDDTSAPEPTYMEHRLLREVSGESDLSKAVALVLHDRRIAQIQCLESCPNLRTIDLSFNNISKIEGLSASVKLRELKLYDNRITQIGTGLQPLTLLHTLDLSSNRLTDLQGLKGLRGLKVLRLAHNQLTSLEGLGQATQLEVLDATGNGIKNLAGLSSCVSLKELMVGGNQLSNLKGMQRCSVIQELHAPDNKLTTLQGLRMAVGTLDVLNVSSNSITSLDSLADNCTALSELYAADNGISSLQGIKLKAPNLETLDVALNRLAPELSVLTSALAPLTSLSSIRLVGNQQLPPGYPQALLDALPGVDSVDTEERPPPADVLVVEQTGDEVADEDGLDNSKFEPTIAEMEQFKQRLGIKSVLPILGRPATPSSSQGPGAGGSRPPSAHAMLRSSLAGSGVLRPGTSGGRPGSSLGGRPGSARPGSAGGAGVKDIMMHQRPPSARTGGSAQLMGPEQYTKQVAGFRDTMEQYSTQLRAALSAIKEGLKLNVADAASQLKASGAAGRDLPSIPRMPALPKELGGRNPAVTAALGSGSALGARADGGTSGPNATGPSALGGGAKPAGGTQGAGAARAPPSPSPAPGSAPGAAAGVGAAGAVRVGLARDTELDAPEIQEAMDLYKRLFPEQQQQQQQSPGVATAGGPALRGPGGLSGLVGGGAGLAVGQGVALSALGSSALGDKGASGTGAVEKASYDRAAMATSARGMGGAGAGARAGFGEEEEEGSDREEVIRGDGGDDEGDGDRWSAGRSGAGASGRPYRQGLDDDSGGPGGGVSAASERPGSSGAGSAGPGVAGLGRGSGAGGAVQQLRVRLGAGPGARAEGGPASPLVGRGAGAAMGRGTGGGAGAAAKLGSVGSPARAGGLLGGPGAGGARGGAGTLSAAPTPTAGAGPSSGLGMGGSRPASPSLVSGRSATSVAGPGGAAGAPQRARPLSAGRSAGPKARLKQQPKP